MLYGHGQGGMDGMYSLMIVEDDIDLNRGLCKALKNEELQVIPVTSLTAAREELAMRGVSMVLLDINLPDGSGLDLMREIKGRTPDTAVLLLTANDTDLDVVEGLEKGADDYITKPFSLSVLRARVNTQLRRIRMRAEEPSGDNDVYSCGRYMFDFERMIFKADGNTVELSKSEQKLLRILLDNRGITVRRDVLIDRIWTDGAEYVDANALSVTVRRLRSKLDAGEDIRTVYGIGYSWVKDNG